ncbi:MAG: VWA domain-containing protein [Firmicutes bacterium]|nr:VWA domain-containing protein [Bacillota bacterium]
MKTKKMFGNLAKIAALILGVMMAFLSWGCGAAKSSAPTGAPFSQGMTSQSGGNHSNSTEAPAAAAPNMPAAEPPAAGYSGSASANRAPADANKYSQWETGQQVYADEEYLPITENPEKDAASNPLITFSLKVDTASYRNVARYIGSGNLPPADAVRVEEMINYFAYDQALPENDAPFSIYAELGRSMFDEDKTLAFVRVKAKDADRSDLPRSSLTFLIDSSGSMASYDKLPLLKSSFGLLVDTLTENDTVSIVTYAGSSYVVLDSVAGDQKQRIMDAINSLRSNGSTAGGVGINTAYALAEKNFIEGGNNRVILATDGDFNVGVSDVGELEKLISDKRDSGVYLSVLGFGTENLKDNKMETLAKNGNGNYSYIDNADAAQKVLVDELASNLYTIADDVKAQIEFNPALVGTYRLLGYENSVMANRDFANDAKDAGEIGVGTDVVMMFELTLTGGAQPLKYQSQTPAPAGDYSDELFEVRIRYKDPGQSESKLIAEPVKTASVRSHNTGDFIFAECVAGFGQMLRGSEYAAGLGSAELLAAARDSLGEDRGGYRREFVSIVEKYAGITGR